MSHVHVVPSEKNARRILGYQLLIDTLTRWGVIHYSGMTGGGVIHFLKYLKSYSPQAVSSPSFMTLSEYSGGFFPLGYFIASGRYAAAVATTGAATKLLACGLSDAKLHDIPAVYIIAQSDPKTYGLAPLQDTSLLGSNMVAQLRCELPDGVFVLDNPATLTHQLQQAQHQLEKSKPVVLVLLHSALNNTIPEYKPLPTSSELAPDMSKQFITAFRSAVKNKKVTVLVGEEMARLQHAKEMTTQLSTALQATTIWSINGANAIDRANPYGYGYISFGGNDKAIELYQRLDKDDVLLILGACPDEYTVNLGPFTAYRTFYLSHLSAHYGLVSEELAQQTQRQAECYTGDLTVLLTQLIAAAERDDFEIIPALPAPENLNNRTLAPPRQGYVDMCALYQQLDALWPEQAISFDDVCLAYKDRQYVTQRPNNHINCYSLYRGSAMGGAFGLAVGARVAAPQQPVFCFTGDGCFRLFSGSLGEAKRFGLVIFLLNNARLSIVSQGIPSIIPGLSNDHCHTEVVDIDYCAIAQAHGWHALRLSTDLAELSALLRTPLQMGDTSLLIEVNVDPEQILGQNPRANNL